jgi:hypothetical protein
VYLLLQLVPILSASLCSTALLRILESNVSRIRYLENDPSIVSTRDDLQRWKCSSHALEPTALQGVGAMAMDPS